MEGFRSLWREAGRLEILPQSPYSIQHQNASWPEHHGATPYQTRNEEWRTIRDQITPIQGICVSSRDQLHPTGVFPHCDPVFQNLTQTEPFHNPSSFNASIQM